MNIGWKKTIWLCALLLLAVPAVSAGPSALKGVKPAGTALIQEILKSDMVMADTTRRFRLDDVRIPVDYDQDARARLNELLLNKNVTLYSASGTLDDADRYGVPLVHLMRGDGAWIQGDLVAHGLAWAFSNGTKNDLFPLLLDMEAAARTARLGFWANTAYDIKTADTVGGFAGSFQIVEGKILSVTIKKQTTFINFGRDWKTDFTLELPSDAWDLFTDQQKFFDPHVWQGRTVRVLGWVENKNGPMIRLEMPQQIEFLKSS